ncbi:MAG: hypothetical protein M3495_10805, partial [Pseudomonadota bacterium]|nr:hypothetical protein [Pseudomonadota bacterium]
EIGRLLPHLAQQGARDEALIDDREPPGCCAGLTEDLDRPAARRELDPGLDVPEVGFLAREDRQAQRQALYRNSPRPRP